MLPALDQEVKVIVHKAKCMNPEGQEFDVFRQVVKEFSSVLFIMESSVAGICPGKYMVQAMGKIDSLYTSHKKS